MIKTLGNGVVMIMIREHFESRLYQMEPHYVIMERTMKARAGGERASCPTTYWCTLFSNIDLCQSYLCPTLAIMSVAAQIVEAFGIQPGSELAGEINKQLASAEIFALQQTGLTPDERANSTRLSLVSRGGVANATFHSPGSILPATGTCNKDGSYVCFGKQEPPRVPGPYEFIVEGRCIRVYRLKQLVWQCGEQDE